MEKQQSEEAREIRAQARRLLEEANSLPIEAVYAWIDKTAEAMRLYEFAKWLE